MERAAVSLSAPPAVVFNDGLGERRLVVDPTGRETYEWLCLRSELASVPSFEFALRERVGRLAGFRHPTFGRVRSVERLNDPDATLTVVSDHVNGVRLSEFLTQVDSHDLALDINSALCLIRQLVPAVALLHESSRDAAHGAIGPERLIVTPDARLTVVEYACGSALDQLRYSPDRYWSELRVPLPRSAGPARFDQRTDVLQIGITALSLVLGRLLQDEEFPSRLGDVLASTWAVSARGGFEPLPPGLRGWLGRALQLDSRNAFTTAIEARDELDRVLGEGDLLASPISLEGFLAKYATEVGPIAAPAAATPFPHASSLVPAVPMPAQPLSPPRPTAVAEPLRTVAEPPRTVAEPLRSVVEPSRTVTELPRTIAPPPAPLFSPAAAAIVAPPVTAPVPYVAPPVPAPIVVQAPAPAPFVATPAPNPPTGAEVAFPTMPTLRLPDQPARAAAAEPLVAAAISSLHAANLDQANYDQWQDATADEEAATPVWKRPAIVGAAVLILAVVAGGAFASRRFFAAAPVARHSGTLVITSNPSGAATIVDGEARGMTPLTLTLTAGPHEVEIQSSGGTPRVIPVTVTEGSQTSQYIELPKTGPTLGQLQVRTEPAGAEVTVDAIARGRAPVLVTDLTAGEHTVQVASEIGSMKQTVTIEAGTTASLVVPLSAPEGAPLSGWIAVSAPITVQVFEHDRLLGASDTDRIMIGAGKHELDLVNDALGYRATRAVQVAAGKVASIKVDVPTGTIALNATPWAEVWIDGEKVGDTPIGNYNVPLGTHDVVFRNPDLGEQHRTAIVTLKEPTRLSVDLRKK